MEEKERCFRKYIRDGNIYFVRGYEEGINNVNGVAEFTKRVLIILQCIVYIDPICLEVKKISNYILNM